MDTITVKTCPKCGRELSIDHFRKHNLTKDGYRLICKDCEEEIKLARRDRPVIPSGPKQKRDLTIDQTKTHTNPELAKFKPRELIEELAARGYKGTLTYTYQITL